jgi:hypothetical protein
MDRLIKQLIVIEKKLRNNNRKLRLREENYSDYTKDLESLQLRYSKGKKNIHYKRKKTYILINKIAKERKIINNLSILIQLSTYIYKILSEELQLIKDIEQFQRFSEKYFGYFCKQQIFDRHHFNEEVAWGYFFAL